MLLLPEDTLRALLITLVISSHREEVRQALEPDRIVYVGYGSVWSEPRT